MSIEQAKTYLKYIQNSTVYLGIGKCGAWNAGDSVDTSLINAPDSIIKDMNDAVYLKKTTPQRYTLAAIRYEWEENTVYSQYNGSDANLHKKKFYCINDNGIVYKCISNNNGAPSTEMPNSTTPEKFTTSDGYIWKLIAVVPESISLMFNNSSYIPVKTLTQTDPAYIVQYASQSAAVPGTIDRIDITQPGRAYSSQTRVIIDGDGVGAKASVTRHQITGEILKINVDNSGHGYTSAIVQIIDDSNIGGTGALAVPIISPLNGQGSDPEKELFANTIIGSFDVQGTEQGFINGNFDYRKVFLVTDIKTSIIPKVQASPIPGTIYSNTSNNFKIWFKNSLNAYKIRIKSSITLIGTFDLIASESNPYGSNQQWFTDKGISVQYVSNENLWKIDFGSTLRNSIFNGVSFIVELLDSDGDNIFGNINSPLSNNTFEYSFVNNSSVNNEPQDTFVKNEIVTDPSYKYTIRLNLSNISGTFVMGEKIEFLNGGSAEVVFIGSDYIEVSSPISIMTGDIHGITSGANARVISYVTRPFSISGTPIYQQYLDKHTKLSNQNIKIVPIFEF